MDEHVADAVERGAEVVAGGARADGFPTRLYWPATVLDRVPRDSIAVTQETFGPIAPIVSIGSLEEAIEQTNSQSFGLMAAIFTGDVGAGLRFADSVHMGLVNVNETTNYWEAHLPWGGRGRSESGIGRVGGSYPMETLTELQTVLIRSEPGRDAMTSQFDFVIVGGGSAGCALANRLSADPANRVLVLEAGRPDWSWDVFIHMPAALAFPIGNRFYDWKYESEPEPHMGGRRVYHARGKVLGGSSSVNGMIFQRGNPMDYERWASGEGMETWDYAHCLPYFKRMENCLAAAPDDPFRGHDGPLVLERGPARGPLFDAFFAAVQEAGYRADRRRERLPAGGIRALRSQRARRKAAVGGARLPSPGDGSPEPRGRDLRVRDQGACSRAAARWASNTRATGVAPSRRGAARSSSAAGRSTLRSSCSSRAWGRRRPAATRHRRGPATCPGWARTSRTTSRSMSSTAPPSRFRWRRTS